MRKVAMRSSRFPRRRCRSATCPACGPGLEGHEGEVAVLLREDHERQLSRAAGRGVSASCARPAPSVVAASTGCAVLADRLDSARRPPGSPVRMDWTKTSRRAVLRLLDDEAEVGDQNQARVRDAGPGYRRRRLSASSGERPWATATERMRSRKRPRLPCGRSCRYWPRSMLS